jgi:hypothetical protein
MRKSSNYVHRSFDGSILRIPFRLLGPKIRNYASNQWPAPGSLLDRAHW